MEYPKLLSLLYLFLIVLLWVVLLSPNSILLLISLTLQQNILPTNRFLLVLILEQLGRAKEKTVLRISNKKELAQAPSPSALWSAKEAAYKSISSLQSDIHIKHISIFDWQSIVKSNTDTKIHNYQFTIEDKTIKGKGVICCLKNIITGLAFSLTAL